MLEYSVGKSKITGGSERDFRFFIRVPFILTVVKLNIFIDYKRWNAVSKNVHTNISWRFSFRNMAGNWGRLFLIFYLFEPLSLPGHD